MRKLKNFKFKNIEYNLFSQLICTLRNNLVAGSKFASRWDSLSQLDDISDTLVKIIELEIVLNDED